jgi:hypothetical protein
VTASLAAARSGLSHVWLGLVLNGLSNLRNWLIDQAAKVILASKLVLHIFRIPFI